MIEIDNLTKYYGKRVILQNINLQIPDHKIIFIAGRNGSGKTTLLKCLLNLEQYKGTIRYNNQPLDEIREDLFVIYDSSPLYSNLTGVQNIKLLTRSNITTDSIISQHYQMLSKEILKKKVKTYSFGQRKKLSLIIALINKPKFLFLDEVSNGLDYESLNELQILLRELTLTTTIVAIGHNFEYYSPIIDELILINDNSALHISDYQSRGKGDIGELYTEHIKQQQK